MSALFFALALAGVAWLGPQGAPAPAPTSARAPSTAPASAPAGASSSAHAPAHAHALAPAPASGGAPSFAPSSAPASAPAVSGRVLVFAAASLHSAFEAAKLRFEAAHPRVKVDLSFAGTPQLVQQIAQGAPADLLASADDANAKRVADAGHAGGPPRVFARNVLRIVVEAGNPRRVAGLADLARADLKVALCAPNVPAGAYSREALAKAGVNVSPVSEEASVKAIVAKVALGEIDAGIVYATDVPDSLAGARVAGVAIPDAHNVVATYPLVPLKTGRNPAAARAFADFLASPEGLRLLESFGFRAP